MAQETNIMQETHSSPAQGGSGDLAIVEEFNQAIHELQKSTSLEHWINFAVFLLLGAVLGWTVGRLLKSRARAKRKLDAESMVADIMESMAGSSSLLIFVYFFSIGIDVLHLPGWLWQRVQETLMPIIFGVVFTTLLCRLTDIVALVSQRKLQRAEAQLDVSLIRLVTRIVKTLIVMLVVLFVVNSIFGLSRIIPLLTGLGFFGAAMALAAQHIFTNIFAAFAILFDRVFRVGDRIRFDDYDGFVTNMGLRSIKLTAMTGESITLPNKDVADRQVRNLTKGGLTLVEVSLGLIYGTPAARIDEAMKLLEEVLLAHPRVRQATVRFKSLSAYSLDVVGFGWADYKTSAEYGQMLSELNLEIKKRFDAAGLAFAFPTQTIDIPMGISPAPLPTTDQKS